MISLPRTVKMGTKGKDVDAHARALHRFLGTGNLGKHTKSRTVVREMFGLGKRTLTKKAAKYVDLPQTGVIGPRLYQELRDHDAYDVKADQLLKEYISEVKPRLVEPDQGFDSLHQSLWEVYSIGRNMGLSDLGTYNKSSLLPSGRPSDHAVYPAFAFDLGIDPDTGWNNLKARAYVLRIAGKKQVEYVILGDRIYYGLTNWGRYTRGGHLNHVHVSGNR